MAPVQWSNLPSDILLIVVKILNSDVDLLRLRSVCSSWRSSLPTRMKPYSFPIEVPPFYPNSSSPNLRDGGQCFLNYSTLYRLSPPEHAGNSSDGWLLRVLEVKPNTFSLLTPLLHEEIDCHPDMIPKGLNLLDYRISEICKCYHLNVVYVSGFTQTLNVTRKVIVLWNFVEDCDFAVLVLASNDRGYISKNNVMRYWKFGDEDWTPIDTKDYEFDDVIFFDGKCYAIGAGGELVSFGSEFNLTKIYSSNYGLVFNHNNLAVYESDLYIISKIYNREPDEYSSEFEGRYSSGDDYELTPPHCSYDSEEDEEEGGGYDYSITDEDEHSDDDYSIGKAKCIDEIEITDDEDEGSDDEEGGGYGYEDDQPDAEEAGSIQIPLRAKIFRMHDGCEHFKQLEDDEFFLSSDDVSVGVSTKDFGGCKGNCVYMAHRYFSHCDKGIAHGDGHAVFDFDRRRTRSRIVQTARDRAKIYWPPPTWLRDHSRSSS